VRCNLSEIQLQRYMIYMSTGKYGNNDLRKITGQFKTLEVWESLSSESSLGDDA